MVHILKYIGLGGVSGNFRLELSALAKKALEKRG